MIDLENSFEEEMRNFIQEICEKIGPRAPCSSEEAEAANFFEAQIKKYHDNVNIEGFEVHPGAYKAAFRIPMILYLISLTFYWYYPLMSFILAFLSFLILFGEMYMAKEIIDFIFPRRKSQNVIVKINPLIHKKNLLIIGSHLDSNWEFPLIRILGYRFIYIIAINFFLNATLLLILSIKNVLILFEIGLLLTNFEQIFFWIFIISIPIVFIQLIFIISNRTVMGANDNLSGMAVCYSLAKALTNDKNKPKYVEVWICIYGCEEIGSKGSKAFVEKHIKEIRNAKVINLDTIGHKGIPLHINNSEIFGLVKMDKKMIDLIKNSAEKLKIDIRLGTLMAYTDSMSFGRKKLSAISISTLPHTRNEFFYHTRNDVIENLDFENLIKTYNICIDIIHQLDK